MADIDALREWLIVKRDLYYLPNYCGYTGIRDNAGRYTEAEAKVHVGDGLSGVSMIKLADAPEFSKACYDDLAREHLQKQRDQLTDALEAERSTRVRLEEALRPFAVWLDKLDVDFADHADSVIVGGVAGKFVTFGDLRRVRGLVKGAGDE